MSDFTLQDDLRIAIQAMIDESVGEGGGGLSPRPVLAVEWWDYALDNTAPFIFPNGDTDKWSEEIDGFATVGFHAHATEDAYVIENAGWYVGQMRVYANQHATIDRQYIFSLGVADSPEQTVSYGGANMILAVPSQANLVVSGGPEGGSPLVQGFVSGLFRVATPNALMIVAGQVYMADDAGINDVQVKMMYLGPL